MDNASRRQIHTLVGDLEHGPEHFVFLLALVANVLGVFHLVGELEERILNILKAIGRGLAVFGCADCGHVDDVVLSSVLFGRVRRLSMVVLDDQGNNDL
jgi:hypothetical protein